MEHTLIRNVVDMFYPAVLTYLIPFMITYFEQYIVIYWKLGALILNLLNVKYASLLMVVKFRLHFLHNEMAKRFVSSFIQH